MWTKCLSGCFGQDQMSYKDMVKIPHQANKKKGELIKQCWGNWLFIQNNELLTSYHMLQETPDGCMQNAIFHVYSTRHRHTCHSAQLKNEFTYDTTAQQSRNT